MTRPICGHRAICSRAVYSVNELKSQTGALTVVPDGGICEFGGGFRLRPEDSVHLSVNRCRMRVRTSSQGSPVDSPLITLRARRWWRVVETGKQLGRHVGAPFGWKRKGLSQKFLRSRRHGNDSTPRHGSRTRA
jgi:hypothetical protein